MSDNKKKYSEKLCTWQTLSARPHEVVGGDVPSTCSKSETAPLSSNTSPNIDSIVTRQSNVLLSDGQYV
jgi:hypothetical protein